MRQDLNDNATRAEAAAYLRVSQDTLQKWEHKGIGPALVRVSPRKALYPWAGLREFLAVSLKMAAAARECMAQGGEALPEGEA